MCQVNVPREPLPMYESLPGEPSLARTYRVMRMLEFGNQSPVACFIVSADSAFVEFMRMLLLMRGHSRDQLMPIYPHTPLANALSFMRSFPMHHYCLHYQCGTKHEQVGVMRIVATLAVQLSWPIYMHRVPKTK